ncbi:hypothetical protein KUV56_13725 [Ferrimonas balearica]|uniref:hypothetical protein n=1 Tax=Ferrimonas balearica TaxID=44012 RepID=UPI001C55BF76|nr:hypothetical protein [Ferrimonas balearica]MBW3140555.1 hypothetical protein [Ferrimonas balearica]
MKDTDTQVSVMLVQKHQLDQGEQQIGDLDNALEALQALQADNATQLDEMLLTMTALLRQRGIEPEEVEHTEICSTLFADPEPKTTSDIGIAPLSLLDAIPWHDNMSWATYSASVRHYAERHHINLESDPFERLMTPGQRADLERRIQQDFTLKTAHCDRYDYMIAGTCGVIGGLVDVFFVGMPGEGQLTHVADSAVDSAVEKFASACGWNGPSEGGDATKSAIGFLERQFKVNYDHRHGGDVDGLFRMSTRNHHIKSLAHSPDLVGLFFSILDQFTSTAHFVSDGKLVSVETETFELKGSNFVAKLFCGFVNWLGHLFSDVAGSSGAASRGSGIPIPFYSLLQFANVGEFGQHRQTFATIAVQVFEKGYDLRHGLAMAIPVLLTELLTRVMWVVKQRCYHRAPWSQCLPSANNPELRRMLMVGHGTLCLVDAGDAALRSGGDMIQFLLRTNLIGWARFGTLAVKELNAWYRAGKLDVDAVDDYLDADLRRMLGAA